MYTPLGEERLKTGERLELGVIECPDACWGPRVVSFLGHKSTDSREHLQRAVAEPLDDLRTRFYIGSVEGRVLTQVMVVGARGAGILGHVYTLPAERRKGAYSSLMQVQMGDMARAGFRLLCLGTGFEGPPYFIYHSFGFRGIGPGRGQMIWRAEPDVEARWFRSPVQQVRPLRWDDWSWFDLLGMQPVAADEPLPRSAVLGLKEQGSLEGPFVPFILQRERDPRVQGWVLAATSGATVGFALAAPDRRWFGDVWAADLYLHPSYRAWAAELLDAVVWPDAPCAFYRAGGTPDRALLEAHGFRLGPTLPRWLNLERGRHDLECWLRD